jgi:hypothetical protein
MKTHTTIRQDRDKEQLNPVERKTLLPFEQMENKSESD